MMVSTEILITWNEAIIRTWSDIHGAPCMTIAIKDKNLTVKLLEIPESMKVAVKLLETSNG